MSSSNLKHPVFKNPHNDGQRTTGHKDVEKARSAVASEGEHPEKGQFKPHMPTDNQGMPVHEPGVQHFKSPKGDQVAVMDHTQKDLFAEVDPQKIAAANSKPPDDQKMTVMHKGMSKTMSKPASNVYLHGKFGIQR